MPNFINYFCYKLKAKFSKRHDVCRDWEIIFTFFILVTAAITFFSFYILRAVNTREFFLIEKSEISSVKTINRGLMDKVVEYYSVRTKYFNESKDNPEWIADPSL